jgi:hypothetical protein
MKWFQHDSDAVIDAKVRKLILRYGPEGYAVYFHCLELIAGDLSTQNINFELEHDAEIIADNLKVRIDSDVSAIDKVNRILKYIIELGLFTINNNRVFCFKMANRLDNTVSRSPEINKIKQLRNDYVDDTKKLGAEEKRIKQKKRKEKRIDYIIFGDHKNVKLTQEQYNKLISDYDKLLIDKKIDYLSWYMITNSKTYKDHNLTIRNWLRNESNKLNDPFKDDYITKTLDRMQIPEQERQYTIDILKTMNKWEVEKLDYKDRNLYRPLHLLKK